MQDKAKAKIQGPHQGQPVYTAGAPLDQAKAAMIMIHGRGARPEDILTLTGPLDRDDFAYLAPKAADNTWYPFPFMQPIESNEPNLTSALQVIDDLLAYLAENGFGPERVMLLGFSQGACLAQEYAARHATRYGGLAGLSGGLIGPNGTPRDYPGSMDHTPVFLGCSDVDFHIPKERVLESGEVFKRLGADVTTRLYPGMGHTVNDDEIAFVQGMMKKLAGEAG
jgi:predicted esterase